MTEGMHYMYYKSDGQVSVSQPVSPIKARSPEGGQPSTSVDKSVIVCDSTILRWKVWAARELLRFAIHCELPLRALCGINAKAFLLCPEGAALACPEPQVIPKFLLVSFIIAGYRLAILRIVLVPPLLAPC